MGAGVKSLFMGGCQPSTWDPFGQRISLPSWELHGHASWALRRATCRPSEAADTLLTTLCEKSRTVLSTRLDQATLGGSRWLPFATPTEADVCRAAMIGSFFAGSEIHASLCGDDVWLCVRGCFNQTSSTLSEHRGSIVRHPFVTVEDVDRTVHALLGGHQSLFQRRQELRR